MKKFLLIFGIVLLSRVISFGQLSGETEIKSTIDQLFDGIRANDSLLIQPIVHQTCTLQTIQNNKDGNVIISKTEMAAFIKSVGTKRAGVQLDERLSGYDIKIDGDMATVWTPYSFFVNNNFSHCGVNAFTLIRQNDSWKILSIDTQI
ncbi:MAG: hypothetical protein NWQ46_00755 [Spirosomaceae bacterium]|nr:hypothetical protein [Spirosomataceae bacterium]